MSAFTFLGCVFNTIPVVDSGSVSLSVAGNFHLILSLPSVHKKKKKKGSKILQERQEWGGWKGAGIKSEGGANQWKPKERRTGVFGKVFYLANTKIRLGIWDHFRKYSIKS